MERIKIDSENYSLVKEKIKSALQRGEVVVLPTDTVYGLVADALNEKAVAKVFKIKRRPRNKPLPVFVESVSQAERFCYLNSQQRNFLEKVWPGQVTAVLPSRENSPLPEDFFQKEKKIALRTPGSRLVLDVLKELRTPLTGTSANLSGQSGDSDPEAIIRQFETLSLRPFFLIDRGILPNKASTIVDIARENVRILRKGILSESQIQSIWKECL